MRRGVPCTAAKPPRACLADIERYFRQPPPRFLDLELAVCWVLDCLLENDSYPSGLLQRLETEHPKLRLSETVLHQALDFLESQACWPATASVAQAAAGRDACCTWRAPRAPRPETDEALATLAQRPEWQQEHPRGDLKRIGSQAPRPADAFLPDLNPPSHPPVGHWPGVLSEGSQQRPHHRGGRGFIAPALEVLEGLSAWLEQRAGRPRAATPNAKCCDFRAGWRPAHHSRFSCHCWGPWVPAALAWLFGRCSRPSTGGLGLALLGPLAGVIYRKRAERQEGVEIRLMNPDGETGGSTIRVRAHRDELIALELELAGPLDLASDGSLLSSPI